MEPPRPYRVERPRSQRKRCPPRQQPSHSSWMPAAKMAVVEHSSLSRWQHTGIVHYHAIKYCAVFLRLSTLFPFSCAARGLRHGAICYNQSMEKQKRRRKEERPVFDSIRKPTAPPSRKFGSKLPEERVHPALRKVKHKSEPENED